MIDLSDIAALPHGEGKAVAISLHNERLRLKSQLKDLSRKRNRDRDMMTIAFDRSGKLRIGILSAMQTLESVYKESINET